jgi:hypothetical protein
MSTFFWMTLILTAQSPVAIRFETAADGGRQIIARLPDDVAGKLPAGRLSQEQGDAIFTVMLLPDDTKKPGPSMLGAYQRHGNELIFTPRFPLVAAQTYRAQLNLEGKTSSLEYRMPASTAKAPPRIVKILPTADVLPANHLKFYIYFDRPMRGGKELFKQFVLVDHEGKEIDDPWLLDEIWDENNNCLILYIHPGRIKWGVELRELLGPVLFANREYSLVVRRDLTDLDGNKLGKDVMKKFKTLAEDRSRIDLSEWKLSTPKAFTRDPLTLTLSKSIDHRSLQKYLTVVDSRQQPIAGTIAIGADEKSWRFTPEQPWQDGDYGLNIHGDLEDVAGNTPLRPFDLDLQAPKLAPQKLRLDFHPR